MAEHIRTSAAGRRGSISTRPSTAESRPPSELVAPLIGRASAFSQLTGRYQQARQGQPQAVLVGGEAGGGQKRRGAPVFGGGPGPRGPVRGRRALSVGGG